MRNPFATELISYILTATLTFAINEFSRARGRERSAEQVVLDPRAALLSHLITLRACLDALHRDACAKMQGDPHYGPDDFRRIRIADLADERAVDLDLVEGKAAQIAQAGVNYAEVVQRDANTRRPETMQAGDHRFRCGRSSDGWVGATLASKKMIPVSKGDLFDRRPEQCADRTLAFVVWSERAQDDLVEAPTSMRQCLNPACGGRVAYRRNRAATV